MAKYRKKPVIIEAIQFIVTKEIPCKYGIHSETNSMEIAEFMGIPINVKTIPDGTKRGKTVIPIETLKGTMNASLNDYIIKGVNGEFYPCKPDIFEMTYEPVIEESPEEKEMWKEYKKAAENDWR
jgi:hypothetical protein